MSNLLFLYRASRGLLPLWFFLTILSVVMEFATFNAILPVFWESDSFIKDVLNNFYARIGVADEHILKATIIMVAVIYFIRNVFLILQSVVISRMATSMQVDIKLRLLGRIDSASYYPISMMNMGVVSNAVIVEASNISLSMRHMVATVSQGMFAVALFILVAMLEPLLIAAVLVVAVPYYFAMGKIVNFSKRISEEQTENNGRIQSMLVQMLSALKYIKNSESSGSITGILRANIRKHGRLLFIQHCFTHVLHNSTDLVLVLLVLAGLFFYAVPTGNSIIGILFVLFILRKSMVYATTCQYEFRQYLQFHGSIKIINDLDTEIAGYEAVVNPDAVPPDLSQPLQVEDVSFCYPTSSDDVLKNVSMTIPAGHKAAIVGASGSGKSTLAMLLTGVLQPTSGTISLAGMAYDKLDLPMLRSQIGYVAQENDIFNDTVINNVTLWSPSPSLDQVESSLAIACALDFVNELPDNVETPVGDHGNTISGGQRQRISIAREIYKNGRILILDEAASALDSATELDILRNILECMEDTTVIAITHRIAATRMFDTIYVLEDGRLVEQGSYDDLYNAGGCLRALADAQGVANGS